MIIILLSNLINLSQQLKHIFIIDNKLRESRCLFNVSFLNFPVVRATL